MKKKILVEAGVPKSVSDQFKNAGYDVERLDGVDDKGDQAILQQANENGQVLVTEDKDFGTLVYKNGQHNNGVIIIDNNNMTKDEKSQQVNSLISNYGDDIENGNFIRVHSDGIRSIEQIRQRDEQSSELSQPEQGQEVETDLAPDAKRGQNKGIGGQSAQQEKEPSLEERQEALKQKSEAFKDRQQELKEQIENAPDEKTRERLKLEAKLENTDFTRTYNNEQASILGKEDPQKNADDITILKHDANKADKEYKQGEKEWHARAVRDDDYEPKNEAMARKVDKARQDEKKSWSEFSETSQKNGYDESRTAEESKKLQEKLDKKLTHEFGLQAGKDYGMGM